MRIRPRSALTRMPNATDAMTIAIVERMRLVDAFIDGFFNSSWGGEAGQGRLRTPAAPQVPAGGAHSRRTSVTRRRRKCSALRALRFVKRQEKGLATREASPGEF